MASSDPTRERLVVGHTLRSSQVWFMPMLMAASAFAFARVGLPLDGAMVVYPGLAVVAVVGAAWALRPFVFESHGGQLRMWRRFGRPREVQLRGARSAFLGRRLRVVQSDGTFVDVVVPGGRDAHHEVGRLLERCGVASFDPSQAVEAKWLEPALEARRHDGEVYNLDPVHAPMPMWLLIGFGLTTIAVAWLGLMFFVPASATPWLMYGLFPLLAALPVVAWWAWVATWVVVGVRLTLTSGRLLVSERMRWRERTWSVDLDALRDVRLDARRLVLTTEARERALRLPSRSHATRAAIQRVVEAQQERAAQRDRGDPSDVPSALGSVAKRARPETT